MPSKDQERWKRLAALGAKREIPTPLHGFPSRTTIAVDPPSSSTGNLGKGHASHFSPIRQQRQ